MTSTVDADPGGTTSRVFAAGAEDEVTGVGRLLSSLQAGLFGQRGELQTIGRYEVLRRLGSGGAGVVYRGRDPELGREVAIKLLRADQRGTQWRERMLREAQAMAKVEHPNVIEIYDVGVHRDGPDKSPAIYIVMELIDGLDLHKWWNPERAWTEVIEVYLQAARGLEAAHRHGLVHRDFKPSNVMLDERGRVRVLDFGLVRGDQPSWSAATISASDPEADYAPLTGLTETGGVLGTPPYMAPEQHAAQEIDARADQYSLCVALFEALYRERPFPQTTLSDLQEAKTSGHVVPVERRDVPVEVDAIVRRGLSPDPDDRFASMTQVVGALERCLKPPRRTRRILAWVGAVTITVAAAATVVGVGTQACKDGTIAPLWTEARAVGVRETFVAASSALGATTADRVGERLQARDQRTQHTWTTACDEREQGRASAERLGAIERCLEERQAEAAAVLDAFTEADARMVSTALSAVYQLSPPAGCLDPPPSEPKHDEPSYRALSTEVARLKGMAQAGQLEQALVRGEALVARAEAAGHAELEARLRYRLGLLLVQGGDAAQGIEHLEKSALLAAGQRDHGTAVAAWAGLAQWHASEGGSLENARKALRHAEAAAELLPGDASSQRLLWSVRGIIAADDGRTADALEAYGKELQMLEDLFGEGGSETWIGHAHLGLVRRRMGALAEAEARYRTAIEIIETEYGPLHPDLFTLRGNLGNVLFDRGQRKAALQQFERALEAIDGASERDNLRRVMLLVRIGATHMMLGELDQAEPRYQQALETLRRMDAMGGVIAAEAMHNYALLEQRRGHIDRAVSLYEGALEIRRELDGQRQATVNTLINLGVIESERGRLEQAEAWARQALALATEHFPEAGPVRADAEGAMGKVLLRRGRPEQSLRHLERALASQRSLEAPAHERARLVLWIARARTANDEARDRVRPAVEEALREVRAMPEPDRKLEGELVTWIEGGSGVP